MLSNIFLILMLDMLNDTSSILILTAIQLMLSESWPTTWDSMRQHLTRPWSNLLHRKDNHKHKLLMFYTILWHLQLQSCDQTTTSCYLNLTKLIKTGVY